MKKSELRKAIKEVKAIFVWVNAFSEDGIYLAITKRQAMKIVDALGDNEEAKADKKDETELYIN